MLKKIPYLLLIACILSVNLTARDICPGDHYFTFEKVNIFNFPDEPIGQSWQCGSGNNLAIYRDFQPGIQRFEWWTENNTTTSCPKGTTLDGDLCLDRTQARNPVYTDDSLPGEPEKGDAGNDKLCINSYVIPKTREFHEDIEITGITSTLHYASSRTADYTDGLSNYVTTDIANGWTLSNVPHFKAPYLYLGNGSMIKLKAFQYSVNANNETILYDENNIGYQFDMNGNILKSFDALTGKTLFSSSYDNQGLLISITDRFNLTTTIVHDRKGKASSIIAPHGEETKLKIDRKNNLISVKYEDRSAYTFKYDVGALMSQENDPVGNSFLHAFDSYGRIKTVTDSVGGIWDFYNKGNTTYGSVVLTDPEKETTSFENYASVNGVQVSTSTSPSSDVTTVSTTDDELQETTTRCGISNKKVYVYDDITSQKRLVSSLTTTPAGLTNTINMIRNYMYNGTSIQSVEDTINSNGKLQTITTDYTTYMQTIKSAQNRNVVIRFDPISEQPLSVAKSNIEPILYRYDNEGNLLTKKQGVRTNSYQYDARGNVASYTDSLGQVTYYTYDLLNRVTSINHPNGYSTLYKYDANGNMLRLTTPTPADYSFTYNGVNKKISVMSPLGNETLYNYDKKRRLTNIHKPSGKNINYIYSAGRLSSIVRPEGTVTYSYGCGSLPTNITNADESIDYVYDGKLMTQMQYSGVLNESIAYTYNNDFLVSSLAYAGMTQNLLYDNDGLLIKQGTASIVRNSGNGLVESITDGNFTQTNSYNKYGEIYTSDDTINAKSLYGYSIDKRDGNGRIIQKTENVGSNQDVYVYGYDEMGHVTSVHKNGVLAESYTYDANGNRILAGNIQSNYTLEDQLEQVGDTLYAYNQDGYLTSKITSTGETSYDYGSLGELKSVVLQDGTTVQYLYDAQNQRVAKKLNGVITEKYLWADLTTLLAVYDGNDNLVQRFTYADQRMPISMTYNNQTYYLHYDQVGTLKAVADTNGTIVKTITYDSFGNILQDTNSSLHVSFGFAGGLHDRDTNLVHFGYREYDPFTGKWTAKDPIDFSGGDSNLYGYVLGDPVNLVDPSGEFAWIVAGGAAGFIGGYVGYFAAGNTGYSGAFRAGLIGGAGGLIAGALAPMSILGAITFDGLWGITSNAYSAIDGVNSCQ